MKGKIKAVAIAFFFWIGIATVMFAFGLLRF